MSDHQAALPVGRELDALVAERVMGWRDIQFRNATGEWAGYPPDSSGYQTIPYYSTDLAASWEVASYLSTRGYTVDVDNWEGGAASVRLRTPVDGEQGFVGPTPAVAMCRAALAVATADR